MGSKANARTAYGDPLEQALDYPGGTTPPRRTVLDGVMRGVWIQLQPEVEPQLMHL